MTSSEDRFRRMMTFIIRWEGSKYENDPDDPGGATKYGIDQRSHPGEDIRNLTLERATEIYRAEYWDRYRCGDQRQQLGEIIFDTAVNCGIGRVKKIMAAAGSDPARFLAERDAFYRRLASARPRSAKYLRGWLNRTRDLRAFLNL